MFKKSLFLILVVILLGAGFWYRGLIRSLLAPSFARTSTVSVSSPNVAPSVLPTPEVEPYTFRYDSLGITAPITLLTHSDPFNADDWQKFTEALDKGVSVSTTADTVDKATNLYVTGHSSTVKPNPYSFIFASLGQAKEGDTFTFTTQDQRFTYKVVSKQVLDPRNEQDFLALEAQPGETQRAMLVTCWPVFTTKNRLVIVGERIAMN